MSTSQRGREDQKGDEEKWKSSQRESCCELMKLWRSFHRRFVFHLGERARETRAKRICLLINNPKTNKNVLSFWERLLETRKKVENSCLETPNTSRFLETVSEDTKTTTSPRSNLLTFFLSSLTRQVYHCLLRVLAAPKKNKKINKIFEIWLDRRWAVGDVSEAEINAMHRRREDDNLWSKLCLMQYVKLVYVIFIKTSEVFSERRQIPSLVVETRARRRTFDSVILDLIDLQVRDILVDYFFFGFYRWKIRNSSRFSQTVMIMKTRGEKKT